MGVPFTVVRGVLPTMMNPPGKTPSAVFSPRPWGPWKNVVVFPAGSMLTMLTPVACKPLVPLLKSETKMSPGLSFPPAGKSLGMNATP